MKTLDIEDANASLADFVQDVGEEPLIVSRKGKPVAALIAISNADWETTELSTNPQFIALIERSRKRHEQEGGLTSEQMRRRLGLADDDAASRSKERPRKRERKPD